MPFWKYTNLLLINIDIQERTRGEGAPKEQNGIYTALRTQVFTKELLEFQSSNEYGSYIKRTGSVKEKKKNSDYNRYMKSITSVLPIGNTLFLPFLYYIHFNSSQYNLLQLLITPIHSLIAVIYYVYKRKM